MAVVPMQKVRVVVHQHDVGDFLTIAQRFGAMEFTPVNDTTLTDLSGEAPRAALLARLQHGIAFLTPYERKRSLWRTLRDGSTNEFTEVEIANRLADTDAVQAIVNDIESLQVEMAEKTEQVRYLSEQHQLLKTWEPVTSKLSNIQTQYTTSFLVIATDESESIEARILETVASVGLTEFGLEALDRTRALVTVLSTEQETTLAAFANPALTVIDQPAGTETAQVELAAIEEQLAAAKGELGVVHDQAEHVAQTHLRQLRVAAELFEWERDRFTTLETGKSTTSTAVFEGWIIADKRHAIEQLCQEQNIAASISEQPLAPEDEPPVEIANNPLIKPFEVVTRLYGMPGYRDLDPTLFLAGFFFLFFGLSLTDVGYGVFLMVSAITVLTLFKVAPVIQTFMKLLFFMGLGSALVGLLFGGYLGIAPESLPDWLLAIQLFDPIANPLPVFYLALGLGVFQVMVGMLLKIYSDARNDALIDGLLDQGPWLLVFTLGILYVGVLTDYVGFVTTDTIVKLLYVAVALVAVASGRKGKTLFGMITAALLALYNSIGYFSDILSYSRLLALGLATTALAFAVNLIAEIVSGTPVVGPVLAIVVLVIGHLFTLAVNTLGAFIHSARLQFVEFFGKFISGTGRAFSPLARSERYVTARSDRS